MAKVTFSSNVKDIIKNIEGQQKDLQRAKAVNLGLLGQAAFQQVRDKYIVPGKFAMTPPGKSKLIYTTPPGANLNSNKYMGRNPRTGQVYIKSVPLFVKGKVVSRTGAYQKDIEKLATMTFPLGRTVVGMFTIEVTPDSFSIYTDSAGEAFKLETMGKDKKMPLTKAFRSIVRMWTRLQLKIGKPK